MGEKSTLSKLKPSFLVDSRYAIVGGVLVTIVLMLYHTVSDMIKTLGPGDSDALLVSQEEKQEA